MMRHLLTLLATACLLIQAGCLPEDLEDAALNACTDNGRTEAECRGLAEDAVDQLAEIGDALCGQFICGAEEDYADLATATGGIALTVNKADQLEPALVEVIHADLESAATAANTDVAAYPGFDIAFLIDKTGSMADDIDAVRSGLNAFFTAANALSGTVRFAAGAYGDANVDGENWFESVDFDNTVAPAQAFADAITAHGGGDLPESIYDGIVQMSNALTWRDDAMKVMIVIGDAGPLKGAKTTHTREQVIELARSSSPSLVIVTVLTSPI